VAGIVIVGGGVIGSSIAYYLRCAGADVTVIEPDPTYEFAATPRAIGGIRMLHGVRENVEMSRYGYQVFRDFKRHVSGGSVDFDPAFREVGYLFMVAGPAAISALERSAEMQRALGVDVTILDRSELGARYPSFAFPGVDAAAYSPADGQIDPNAALMGYRRAAQGRGAVYLQDRVCGIDVVRGAVSAVRLASGASLATRQVVNAANCWAPEVCAMVGMPVPIAPMRRQQFYFTAQSPIEPIPVMREMGGFVLRPEREGYLTGVTRFKEPRGFNWTLEHELFEEALWPALVERSRAFEALRLGRGWVGHYDMNELDGNPVIGPFEEGVDGFFTAAGFSGHGLQHAPAVGRGVAEWFSRGRYESIDLTAFSYRRIIDRRPLPDDGPKA